MLTKLRLLIDPLAETLNEIDTREVPRSLCVRGRLLRVMVRPSFRPVEVVVQDISLKGAGLVSSGPIDPGASLAVLWAFGPPQHWRTIRARVARASPRRRGGWIVGCTFEERLWPDDLAAFLSPESHH
jgi:hypothetical protein